VLPGALGSVAVHVGERGGTVGKVK
jgi:hypothetical protein